MEKKNNIGLVAVLVLIIVLLVGYIIYMNVSDNSTKVENNSPVVEDEKNVSNNGQSNSNNDKNNGVVVKELDLSKSLNTTTTYRNATDAEGNYGLSMSINSDKKSVTLSIDWSKFCDLSTASACSPDVENYQITGFSKEVSNVFVGDLGQDSMGITLFYLMNDGTVEYTPMFKRQQDSYGNGYYVMNYTYEYEGDKIVGEHFTTDGSLNGVSNVIKFYNVDASSAGSGARTTIGATTDGSFYDLGHIINN